MGLTIGSIVLHSFEIPPSIRLGTTQRLAVHRLGNGRRVVDALGADALDITFSGVLSGQDATSRAALLDGLCRDGQPVPMSWDDYHVTVVPRVFEATYVGATWIPYTMACVLSDQGDAAPQPTSQPGLTPALANVQAAMELNSEWTAELTGIFQSLSTAATDDQVAAAATAISALVLTLQRAIDDAPPASSEGQGAAAHFAQRHASATIISGYLRLSLRLIPSGSQT